MTARLRHVYLATLVMFGFGPVEVNAQPETLVSSTASDSEQPDVLLFWNGEQISGEILNREINFRTAYARLNVSLEQIAEIDLEDQRQSVDFLTTVNGDRFSGFIEESSLQVKTPTGETATIRREKIRKVFLHSQDANHQDKLEQQRIVLRNGDFFYGVISGGQFVEDSAERKPIDLNVVGLITFLDEASSRVKIRLRNGEETTGRIEAEDLEIQLNLGPQITLYRNRISRIYCQADYITPALDSESFADIAAEEANVLEPRGKKNRKGMIWIPPGSFLMGSPDDELDRDSDEGPQTHITITQGFWMGEHEVTQAQYEALMGQNPSYFKGDSRRPVDRVSWNDAMQYCIKLTRSEMENGGLPEGYAYRLPTEAEWEYACRAGASTRFHFGNDPDYVMADAYMWHNGNSDSTTHPVGMLKPNPWGLYDMNGNVWEWCLDKWQGSFPGGEVVDYRGPLEGTLRVARGGSWLYSPKFCRSANRDEYGALNRCSDVGFRVILAPVPP